MSRLDAHKPNLDAFYADVMKWALASLARLRYHADALRGPQFALTLGKKVAKAGEPKMVDTRMNEMYATLRTLIDETIEGQCCMDVGIIHAKDLTWISSGLGVVGFALQVVAQNIEAIENGGTIETFDLPLFPFDSLVEIIFHIAPEGYSKLTLLNEYNRGHGKASHPSLEGKAITTNVTFDDMNTAATKPEFGKHSPRLVYNAIFADFHKNMNVRDYNSGARTLSNIASVTLCTAKLFYAYWAFMEAEVHRRSKRTIYEDPMQPIAKQPKPYSNEEED